MGVGIDSHVEDRIGYKVYDLVALDVERGWSSCVRVRAVGVLEG